MTLTFAQLLAAEPVLNRLASERTTAQTRYALAQVVGAVREATAYFQQEREALVKELGAERPTTPAEQETGPAGTVWEVSPEHIPAFVERVRELVNVEVELKVTPLPLKALDAIALSADELLALQPLLGP